jgi:cyclase
MKTTKTRIIPFLLHSKGSLVKTSQFKKPRYIGDTLNTILMFNEMEADEIAILDIDAATDGSGPNFELIKQVSDYCSIPLCYGGGISNLDEADELFRLGVEKVSINSTLEKRPELLETLSKRFGSQATRASIDVRKDKRGQSRVWFKSSNSFEPTNPVLFAQKLQDLGAGEICVTSVDREGTWSGPNMELAAEISETLQVPVVINGGVSSQMDVERIISQTQCSGIGISSLFIFQKQNNGVLIGIPDDIANLSSRWN